MDRPDHSFESLTDADLDALLATIDPLDLETLGPDTAIRTGHRLGLPQAPRAPVPRWRSAGGTWTRPGEPGSVPVMGAVRKRPAARSA